eukprot:3993309-Prymnesium_polylepis.1
MARRSVLAARHGWMRSTGLAHCRTRCPHAALRSHRDRPSIAHHRRGPALGGPGCCHFAFSTTRAP